MDALERAVEKYREAERVVVLTGAGVSAESGVPTFRGQGGLWRNFRAEDLATPEAFERDPLLVWQWYDWRRSLLADVRPNDAHRAIAAMEREKDSFTLVTQNVDGLHSAAGSRNVIELHGSIWRVRCIACGLEREDRRVGIEEVPRCGCGGILRPGVVWFGEALPPGAIERAFEVSRQADFMIVAGTSGVVQPAASLASVAREGGAFVVEVNPEPTPISGVMDVRIRAGAGQVLPAFVEDG